MIDVGSSGCAVWYSTKSVCLGSIGGTVGDSVCTCESVFDDGRLGPDEDPVGVAAEEADTSTAKIQHIVGNSMVISTLRTFVPGSSEEEVYFASSDL